MTAPKAKTATVKEGSAPAVGETTTVTPVAAVPRTESAETAITPVEPEVDLVAARSAALSGLLSPSEPEVAPAPAVDEIVPESLIQDFGGDVVCRVLYSRWTALIGPSLAYAAKGSYIKTTEEQATRGESLGGLVRVG